MCEVRIIITKDKKVRVDVAGYQKQVKTVATHSDLWIADKTQRQAAEEVAADWSKLTGYDVATYDEEEVVEIKLTKVS